jgi:spermidine synthase
VVDRAETAGVPAHREMVHGTIVQGSQFLDPARRREPTSYYARGTGGAMVLDSFRRPGGRVGVIGLGVGGMAAFGNRGETYRFYELNPEVITLAREHFSFVSDSEAHVETVAGDGRLSLEREQPQGFSVLVLDAFSGDSIPVHLLTLEAFDLYFRHLRPDGAIVVNLGNDVVDLRPVVAAAAKAFGRTAVQIRAKLDPKALRVDSLWVLVVPPAELAARPELLAAGEVLEPDPSFAPWTDAHSNLFAVLRR